MAGRRTTVRELIVCICEFFQINPSSKTLAQWEEKLKGLPGERMVELLERITDTWDRWDQYGNFPKRVWSTYYSLPKYILKQNQDDTLGKEVSKGQIKEFEKCIFIDSESSIEGKRNPAYYRRHHHHRLHHQ